MHLEATRLLTPKVVLGSLGLLSVRFGLFLGLADLAKKHPRIGVLLSSLDIELSEYYSQ